MFRPICASVFTLSLLFACVLAVPTNAQVFLSDDFNRPNGVVGNGWTTFHNGVLNSPDITIEGNQLKTYGSPFTAGGIERTLPITFPIAFSFQFRTDSPADGGFVISFNAQASGSYAPPAQVEFYQYRGSSVVGRIYRTPSNTVVDTYFSAVGQRDYRSDTLATIAGIVNPDLSSIINITYNDGQIPATTTFYFPAAINAATVAPGSTFVLSNSNATSGPHFFDNLRVTAVTEPSNINVQANSTGATITWTTNVPANSVVEYGKTNTYGQSVSAGGLVTSHSLNLVGLSSGTLYHYRVKSTDANGHTTVSADNTFVTGPLGYIDFHITHSAVRKLSNGSYAVDVTFSNHGGQPIPTVQVTGVVLGNAVATGFFPGSLPLEFGLLGGTQATYTFTFPASAGASGTSVTLAVHGGLLDDFNQYIEFYSFFFRGVPLP